MKNKIKIIAFYLPQYHQIIENDIWWGEGFTEWVNLKKMKPLFEGHNILHPHDDIGFYDLRNLSIRKKQEEIAKKYNIFGFCYHHYWFNGKKLLETPLELMLVDNEPDINFCFNWANENWTRSWNGREDNILMKQTYSESDIDSHYQYLKKFFLKSNYIKIDNKPMFCIYRAGHIEHLNVLLKRWNELSISDGFDGIHFVSILGSFEDSQFIGNHLAYAEFNPNYSNYLGLAVQVKSCPHRYDITKSWERIEKTKKVANIQYYGTFVSWDNTPRRNENGIIFVNNSSEKLQEHLIKMKDKVMSDDNQDNFLFVNAWNEWGEQMIMEPTLEKNYEVLEIFKNVIRDKKFKVGAVYNTFYGLELIEKSIKSIRDYVDYIVLIHQKIGFNGNQEPKINESIIDKLLYNKLIDEIVYYDIDTNKDIRENILIKRNIGLDYCRENKCLFMMPMDTDEIYNSDELEEEIEFMFQNKIDTLYSPIYSYYYDEYHYFKDTYFVSSVYNIDNDKKFEYNIKSSVLVDPLRKIKEDNYKISKMHMHHYTYLKDAYSQKLNNKITSLLSSDLHKDIMKIQNWLQNWTDGDDALVFTNNLDGSLALTKIKLDKI